MIHASRLRLFAVCTLLLLLIGAFYWYSMRPYFARKGCVALAVDKAGQISDSLIAVDSVRVVYDFCLHRQGL